MGRGGGNFEYLEMTEETNLYNICKEQNATLSADSSILDHLFLCIMDFCGGKN